MVYYALKIILSAAVIVAVSEIAKRSSTFAALLASLPLTSLLAFIWMHFEAVPSQQIADLSSQIVWLVLPSLILFVLFPVFLRLGLNFWLSLLLAAGASTVGYLVLLPWLKRLSQVF